VGSIRDVLVDRMSGQIRFGTDGWRAIAEAATDEAVRAYVGHVFELGVKEVREF